MKTRTSKDAQREKRVRAGLSSLLVSVHFTEAERPILYILADGKSHHRDELIATRNDRLFTPRNLSSQINNIRVKIRPFHHGILCINLHRKFYYQYVILLSSLG
jgi:hypothetical protein